MNFIHYLELHTSLVTSSGLQLEWENWKMPMKSLPGIKGVAAPTRGFYHCFCLAFPLPKHFMIAYLFISHLCWNLIRKVAPCLQLQITWPQVFAFFHKKHPDNGRGVREVNLHFPSPHLSRSIYLNCYWKINPWKKWDNLLIFRW